MSWTFYAQKNVWIPAWILFISFFQRDEHLRTDRWTDKELDSCKIVLKPLICGAATCHSLNEGDYLLTTKFLWTCIHVLQTHVLKRFLHFTFLCFPQALISYSRVFFSHSFILNSCVWNRPKYSILPKLLDALISWQKFIFWFPIRIIACMQQNLWSYVPSIDGRLIKVKLVFEFLS